MKEKNKKKIIYVLYAIIVILLFSLIFWLNKFHSFQNLITTIEQNTFDIRQTILTKYKKASSDIVIISVDDAAYEYIMDKYGEWPVSRKIWSDVINSIEKVQPKCIIFDLIFAKANLKDKKSDNLLVQSVKNNDNIYLSMNFDNYSDDIRKSAILDDKLILKVKDGALVDNKYVTFINSRTVMKELSDVTENIGIINVTRDNDGIIRNVTPIFRYKDNNYPNLSLKAALNILKQDKISIIANSIIIDDKHIIPLDNSQRAILNWYGGSNTFTHISLWEVLKAQKNNDIEFLKRNFENKIIYIGTTVTSLSDIKSTPVDSNLAGVELHATFMNNILDSNFIKRTPIKADFIISIVLCFIVGYLVLAMSSVLESLVFIAVTLTFYAVMSAVIMLKFDLWVPIVLPFISSIATFILIYCEKFFLKSKDYEQTYHLAVTDGLTGLYNHRYFQEQMIINTNNFNRYGTIFSLILIDIDFFKKFNDTYGHQSGDCVLKQVANIIKKNIRTSDIPCRYGGEEMSVILTNTDNKDAVIAANKICQAVNTNKFTLVNGEKVNVTISLGVATAGQNGTKPQEIIEYSDKCLYKAKKMGRNQAASDDIIPETDT